MTSLYGSTQVTNDEAGKALAQLLAPTRQAVQTVPILWVERGSIRAEETLPVDIKDFGIGRYAWSGPFLVAE
ncbi:MAG: hypothetical protein R3300_01850 [Candidatus Promineifilaceae bacterium]|nr:hypothetical protein [Candidatus Promineifilaceae bacterium]